MPTTTYQGISIREPGRGRPGLDTERSSEKEGIPVWTPFSLVHLANDQLLPEEDIVGGDCPRIWSFLHLPDCGSPIPPDCTNPIILETELNVLNISKMYFVVFDHVERLE